MNKVVRTPLVCPLVPALLLASQAALAQETPRADKHYIGLLATTYNHRTIGENTNMPFMAAASNTAPQLMQLG